MKKPVAALLLSAATAAALAVPAEAAPPPPKPFKTLACQTVINSREHVPAKGTATVWFDPADSTGLAAKNPCAQWLLLGWGDVGPGVPQWELLVAPHASFSWRNSGAGSPGTWRYVGPKQPLDWAPGGPDRVDFTGSKYVTPGTVQDTYGKLVYSTKKVRDTKTVPY